MGTAWHFSVHSEKVKHQLHLFSSPPALKSWVSSLFNVMYVFLSACMYALKIQEPKVLRRGCGIPLIPLLIQLWATMWGWQLNPGPLQEQVVLISPEPSLWPCTGLFIAVLFGSCFISLAVMPAGFLSVQREVSRQSSSYSWIFYVLKCLLLNSVAAHIGFRGVLASQLTLLMMTSNILWPAKAFMDCQVLR